MGGVGGGGGWGGRGLGGEGGLGLGGLELIQALCYVEAPKKERATNSMQRTTHVRFRVWGLGVRVQGTGFGV